MSKNLKNKKKKTNASRFNKALNFRIDSINRALIVFRSIPSLSLVKDYEIRLDELKTLKAYLKNSV